MAILMPVLLLALLVLIVALLYPTGLWGNVLNLVNAVIAGLLATNLWEPVAGKIKSIMPSLVFVVDIFVLWLLFAVIFFAMRFATDNVSKIKVRFSKPVELGGNILFAAWTAWVVVCFATFTLHTAPLSREFMGGGFQAEQPMFFGLSPDRMWLGFVQKMSLGAFRAARSTCSIPPASSCPSMPSGAASSKVRAASLPTPPAPPVSERRSDATRFRLTPRCGLRLGPRRVCDPVW